MKTEAKAPTHKEFRKYDGIFSDGKYETIKFNKVLKFHFGISTSHIIYEMFHK